MTTGRSSIPKVVGILMIIFASLGLLFGLLGLSGPSGGEGLEEVDAFKTLKTMSLVFGVIGLGISALHLVAGISAVKYKANAPKLAISYGVLNIAMTLIEIIVVFAWLKPALDEVPGAGALIGGMMLVMGILRVTWPIIVLALMTRPGAKAACVN